MAYWSQLPPLFDALDVPFPAIQPRAAWTLVEPRIQRLLSRLDLEPEDLADGGQSAIARLTERSRPRAVEEGLERLRTRMDEELASLDSAIAASLPGLKATMGKTRKALSDAVTALGKQIDRETRRRLDTQLGQIQRCAASLFPGGKPQERVTSPFYYLARYGPDVIEDLAAATAAWIEASRPGRATSLATSNGDG